MAEANNAFKKEEDKEDQESFIGYVGNKLHEKVISMHVVDVL